jgi:hypothetical protein
MTYHTFSNLILNACNYVHTRLITAKKQILNHSFLEDVTTCMHIFPVIFFTTIVHHGIRPVNIKKPLYALNIYCLLETTKHIQHEEIGERENFMLHITD